MAAAAVPALLPIMRRMRSGPWRETWVLSLRKSDFSASSSSGIIRAVRRALGLRLDPAERVHPLSLLHFLAPAAPGEGADKSLASVFGPWSLLARPEPLPERLVSAAPDAVVDDALGGWGSPANAFGSEVRAAYI